MSWKSRQSLPINGPNDSILRGMGFLFLNHEINLTSILPNIKKEQLKPDIWRQHFRRRKKKCGQEYMSTYY